jgi:hypothetical protein
MQQSKSIKKDLAKLGVSEITGKSTAAAIRDYATQRWGEEDFYEGTAEAVFNLLEGGGKDWHHTAWCYRDFIMDLLTLSSKPGVMDHFGHQQHQEQARGFLRGLYEFFDQIYTSEQIESELYYYRTLQYDIDETPKNLSFLFNMYVKKTKLHDYEGEVERNANV